MHLFMVFLAFSLRTKTITIVKKKSEKCIVSRKLKNKYVIILLIMYTREYGYSINVIYF